MISHGPLRVGFIGDGSISRSVRATLAATPDSNCDLCAVVTRRGAVEGLAAVHSVDALLSLRPDVVVECASHEAVATHGAKILRHGIPLIVVSIGALAVESLHQDLRDAAVAGNSQLLLAAGAIGGIDALAAVRLGGLESVRYRGRKPGFAWAGTPAEELVDLSKLSAPVTFYRGNAREAARLYPKNSNVAATVALAGLGFEKTEVELVADPTLHLNVHQLHFEGADGTFDFTICGKPSPDNPKTSMLTAHSVAKMLLAMRAPVVI